MIGIYQIKNKVNGKSYVGLSNNIKRRLYEHFSPCNLRSKNTVLSRAIKKYGKNSFVCIILEEFEDIRLLPEKEQFWINKINPEYNMNEGGLGNCGLEVSENTKKKLKKIATEQWENFSEQKKKDIITKNLKGPRIGHPVSRETRLKLRLANLGKKQSAETIMKRSELMKKSMVGNKNGNKIVSAFSREGCHIKTFTSVKEASIFANVSCEQISRALNGKIKTSGGFIWKYGSVETNRDECSGVGVILSHVQARGIRKDEDIVQS